MGADGVAVRCAVCRYVFRVDPPDSASASWRVQTVDGDVFEAEDLPTLRVWVREGRLHPDDTISRTGKHWIRLGDMPEFSDPAWAAHHGDALHLKSNYLNVAENLVDPAHVSFVHPTTLGNAASENVPVHVQTEGEAIVAWRWIRDAEPIGFFKAFGGFTGNVDRWHYYYLYTPCTAVIDFGSANSKQEAAKGTFLRFALPTCPDLGRKGESAASEVALSGQQDGGANRITKL